MALKKVYYANLLDYDSELIRQSKLDNENYVYSKCPVVNHKSNRTFVGFSPIDFNIQFDTKNKLIYCDKPDLILFDNEHIESPTVVVQLNFPKFLFWTYEKNIWFEFNDHPLTSYNNNFVSVGGWFNLSNWPRNMSLAISLVENDKKVIIKRGDPLFRITFHSNNLNDGIILKEEKNPKKIKNKLDEMMENREKFLGSSALYHNLFSNLKLKSCPFKFLHK